jgi:hypothetical protein
MYMLNMINIYIIKAVFVKHLTLLLYYVQWIESKQD